MAEEQKEEIPINQNPQNENEKINEDNENIVINRTLRRINQADLNNIETRLKKRKEKKPIKIKDRMFLQLKRERKPKKQPTPLNTLLNAIYKKGAVDRDEIIGVITSQKLKVDEKTKQLLVSVANLKVNNSKINMTENLINGSLYCYYSCTFKDVRSLTNDNLYLLFIAFTSLQDGKKPYTKELLQSGTIENVQIVSQTTYEAGEAYRGYYQDFEGDFCALNMDIPKSRNDYESIMNLKANKFNFTYNGIDYVVSGNQTSCIIFNKAIEGDIKGLMGGMQILKVENGKIALNYKTVNIKDKPQFISCKIKPESYCPSFLIMPKPLAISLLYKIKVDLNDLTEMLNTQIEKNSIFSGPNNICYWDTIENFYTFMKVYLLTNDWNKKLRGKKIVTDFITKYEKYRPAILLWKQAQLEYQRILYDFYNSFTSKISYDRLTKLRKRLEKYLGERSFLRRDPTYESIVEMFEGIVCFSQFINNQFKEETFYIGDEMLRVLDKFENGTFKNETGDERNLKKIGVAIYRVSCTDDEVAKDPAFPFILSPGGFLGDVIGGRLDNHQETLQELLASFEHARDMVEKNDMVIENEMYNIVNKSDDVKEEIIEKTIDYYLNVFRINKKTMEANVYTNMFKIVKDYIKNDEKINKDLNKLAIQTIMNKRDAAIFENEKAIKKIKKLIKEYSVKINADKNKINNQININNMKINEIKNKNNELKDELDDIDEKEEDEESESEEQKEVPEKEEEEESESEEKPKKKKKVGKKEEKKINLFSSQSDIFFNNENDDNELSIYENINSELHEKAFTNATKASDVFNNFYEINQGKQPEEYITENKEAVPKNVSDLLNTYYIRSALNLGHNKGNNVNDEKKTGMTNIITSMESYGLAGDEIDKMMTKINFDLPTEINRYYKGGGVKPKHMKVNKFKKPKKIESIFGDYQPISMRTRSRSKKNEDEDEKEEEQISTSKKKKNKGRGRKNK